MGDEQGLARAVPVERWAHVDGFRHYLVSDVGRVRNANTGRLLFGERDADGYRKVNLVTDDGSKVKRRVHRLVCAAFNGPQPDGHEVAHLNGAPGDNRAENLAWASRSQNTRHQFAHGTHNFLSRPASMNAGEQHPRAKLTGQQIAELRRLGGAGHSLRALARQFGISFGQCGRILRKENWSAS